MSGRIVYAITGSTWPREEDGNFDYAVTAERFKLHRWRRKVPSPGTWAFEECRTHYELWGAGPFRQDQHGLASDIQVKYDAALLEAERWVEEFKQRDCDESRVSTHYRKEITGDCSTP
mgnify:CR=1 FL=1